MRGELVSPLPGTLAIGTSPASPPRHDEPLWLTVVAAALTTFVFVATLLVLMS